MSIQQYFNEMDDLEEQNKEKQVEKQQRNIKQLQQDLQNERKNNLYHQIDSIDSHSLFKYIVVFSIIFGLSLNKTFSFSFVISILLALFSIYFLYQKDQIKSVSYDKQQNIKLENIIPKPSYFKHDNSIIDLVYEIRKYRNYSEDNFDNMVENIDYILEIHEYLKKNNKRCKYNIDVAKDKMKLALNDLHSLLYSIPNTLPEIHLLNKSLKQLQYLLNNHIQHMMEMCKIYNKKRGYDINTDLMPVDDIEGWKEEVNNEYLYY